MRVVLIVLITMAFAFSQDESWKLYDDSQVAEIRITTAPEAVEFMYADPQSDSMHVASVHFSNAYINETIDSVGLRIRGNTSRESEKKSFKLDFEHFVDGREFYSVDKMNLNGEHNDPSIIRSKLAWDFMQQAGMKASRAAHCAVYINDVYYGLYVSVEHIDGEFVEKRFADDSGNLWKCLWPADLQYRGESPGQYDFWYDDRRVYDLKTNEDQNDYTALARLIKILEHTSKSALPDSLERMLNVSSALKMFAWNVLTGMWDDYWSNQNNYYIYHQPTEDKIYFIPYDYDNTFSIDWFGIEWSEAHIYNWPRVSSNPWSQNKYRPLLDRLMEIPEYRNLYTRYITFYADSVFAMEHWDNRLSQLQAMIAPFAESDTFRTRDYGYTMDDFYNSYTAGHYNRDHVKNGIREYVNKRVAAVKQQASYISSKPIVYEYNVPDMVAATDSVRIEIAAFDPDGIDRFEINWRLDGETNSMTTALIHKSAGDGTVEGADRWVAVLPPQGENRMIIWSLFIRDNQSQMAFYPLNGSREIETGGGSGNDALRINELLSLNDSLNADNAGQYDDWLELYNSGDEPIELAGYFLSDKRDNLTKWVFPDSAPAIGPGEFLLVWCDEDQEQGALHTNFRLSSAGEFVALLAPDGSTVLDSIGFPALPSNHSYARETDGDGDWIVLDEPTPEASNFVVSVEEGDPVLPASLNLKAYPNPFNGRVTLLFNLPQSGEVQLRIYDINGRMVKDVSGFYATGSQSVSWDGRDATGNAVSSGLYIVKLQYGAQELSRKLLYLK